MCDSSLRANSLSTGEVPACAHSCPCVPSAPPPSSLPLPNVTAFALSRCGRRSDGAVLLCAASLSCAIRYLSTPPSSLPDALCRYVQSLQQPQHALRLRALFRSAFLFQASKSKCLSVPDAVILLQCVALSFPAAVCVFFLQHLFSKISHFVQVPSCPGRCPCAVFHYFHSGPCALIGTSHEFYLHLHALASFCVALSSATL
jgi:hypothetical protein